MDIDHLKCFILVAENLSFARAAEALYISQPAVSKQISALEKELGTALFVRSTRHVRLTPAGMSFYKDAKDIVLKAQLAVNRVKKANPAADSLTIGLSNSIALSYLSPILGRFHQQHPQMQPVIEVQDHKTILHLFLDHRLDLLFYYKENFTKKASITFREIQKDHLVCLLPAGHPLAGNEALSMQDLEQETLIACSPLNAPLSTVAVQQQLLKNHPVDQILYSSSIEICHCMVSAGMGVAVLPSILTLAAPEFTSVPLTDSAELSFGVFCHGRTPSAPVSAFLKAL